MIINDKAAIARLNSPLNLINRLKNISSSSRKDAMSLFTGSDRNRKIDKPKIFNPFELKDEHQPDSPFSEAIIPTLEPLSSTTTLDNILENHESQIRLGLAHDKALDLLNASVAALSAKLDDVRADKLPAVITAASKTVESIRRERAEASKNNKDREVHYHFYTPEQKKLTEYEVIDVGVQG